METEKQEQLREKNAEDEAVKRQESLAAQAAFKSKLEGFGKPSVNLTELSTEKNISFLDMRAEVKKLEDMQAKLLKERVQFSNRDPSADLSAWSISLITWW